MILNQTTEYALRAMATLATLLDGESIRSRELAARTHVPPHYLSKVMRRLVVAGLVRGQKGHGGGFRLARPTSSIRFLEILRACDYDPSKSRCAFGWKRCDDDDPCPLHPAWRALTQEFENWAKSTTLDQVAGEIGAPKAAQATRKRK